MVRKLRPREIGAVYCGKLSPIINYGHQLQSRGQCQPVPARFRLPQAVLAVIPRILRWRTPLRNSETALAPCWHFLPGEAGACRGSSIRVVNIEWG